jgi:hypothetical protein
MHLYQIVLIFSPVIENIGCLIGAERGHLYSQFGIYFVVSGIIVIILKGINAQFGAFLSLYADFS